MDYYSDLSLEFDDFDDYQFETSTVNNVTSVVSASEGYAMELALSEYDSARNMSAGSGSVMDLNILGASVPSWVLYTAFGGSTVILLNHGLRFLRKGKINLCLYIFLIYFNVSPLHCLI